MHDDTKHADPPLPRPGTWLTVGRILIALLAGWSVLLGLSMGLGSLRWLYAINEHPPQPPGQMVAIIPIFGAGLGALLTLLGGVCLAMLVRRIRTR